MSIDMFPDAAIAYLIEKFEEEERLPLCAQEPDGRGTE